LTRITVARGMSTLTHVVAAQTVTGGKLTCRQITEQRILWNKSILYQTTREKVWS